jgi:hypothetical protein
MLDRYQRGVSATLTLAVQVNEVGTDPSPDQATVTITRADGTALVTDGAAVNGDSGGFQYVLTPAQTALLDLLTVDWTFTLGGEAQTLTTYAEIVGGFHFNLAELRQFDPIDNQLQYSTDRLRRARTLAETAIEDACGVAFVPRYSYRSVNSYGGTGLDLGPMVTRVRSASLNGVALTTGELADVTYAGAPGRSSGWSSGVWTVGYEHGYPFCPPQVADASKRLARYFLVDSPIDDRFTSVSTDNGTFGIVTEGVRGAPTSIPRVNAVIEQFKMVSL